MAPTIECIDSGCASNLMRVLIRLTAPFYTVVDQLVDELQEHVWSETGKPKRRLKGDGLEKLYYSVECLVRGCVAVLCAGTRPFCAVRHASSAVTAAESSFAISMVPK